MFRKIVLSVSTIIIIALFAARAMAVGLGGYGSFEYSKGSLKIMSKHPYGVNATVRANNSTVGGGFTLDSNILGPSLFNYRLQIGGEKFSNNGESNFLGETGHFFNSFGFKVYGSSRVRLWMGPGFGFRYITGTLYRGPYFGKEDIGILEEYSAWGWDYDDPALVLGNIGIHKSWETYTLFGFEAGLVFGINVALNNSVAFTAEVAGKYFLMTGNRERKVWTIMSLTEQPSGNLMDYRLSKEKVLSHNGSFGLTVGFLFRLGEGNVY